jgi:hypothetical protein
VVVVEVVGVAALADTRDQSSTEHPSPSIETKPPVYLADCVWRFNHRKYSSNEQFYCLSKMPYNYRQIHKIGG